MDNLTTRQVTGSKDYDKGLLGTKDLQDNGTTGQWNYRTKELQDKGPTGQRTHKTKNQK